MRAVVFDGVEIPEVLLAQEVQNHPAASAAEARAAAGHALAIRALLLARARGLGLQPDPQLDELGREETPEEALIRAVLDLEVEAETPTAAECRRVYDADRDRFRTPALLEASHILITPASADEAAVEAARVRAEGLISILGSGVCRFAELAADNSDCPSGAVGGSLGQLRTGELTPEVEAVLKELQPGQIAPRPVLSRFGWHVLKLDRLIDGRPLPFEMVEDRIRLHLESRAWTAAAARYVADLTADARAKGVALTLASETEVQEGSATLGDFLSDDTAADRLEPWLAAADPALHERVSQAASAAGSTIADFTRAAIADFVAQATDERWTNLISAAREAEDPALACLAAVLRSKLKPARQTLNLSRRAVT